MAKERFPGLVLSDGDIERLSAMKRGRLAERTWKRMRMLELLADGWTLQAVADALGTYRREVRRVGWRFIELGLEASLVDEERPKPPKVLSKKMQAAITAMVCGPPPEGFARWTTRLIAAEAVSRGLVPSVGRETIRRFLASHDLKPWREKNVVRPEAGR